MHPTPRTVTLHFSDEARERINALKVKTETDSSAEGIGNALRIYDCLVTEAGENAKVVVNCDDGTVKILPVLKKVN